MDVKSPVMIRTLDPSEHHRLAGIPGHENSGIPEANARVIVAEDDCGEIQAYLFLQLLCAAEPIYIAPEYRKGTIAYRLFQEARRVMAAGGVETYYVHTDDPLIMDYYVRLGLRSTGMVAFEGKVEYETTRTP